MDTSKPESTRKVMVIEDEEPMIDLVSLILNQRDFEIVSARGGQQALDMVADEHPDLVLLDIMMPDIDGWDVYKHMKANEDLRDIPVIVITAKAQNIDRVLGEKIAKVQAYITKPFSPTELLDAIDSVL